MLDSLQHRWLALLVFLNPEVTQKQKAPRALFPTWPGFWLSLHSSFSSCSLSRSQCPIIWHQGWKGSRVGRSGDQASFKTSLIQPFLRAAQPADRSTLTNLSTQGLARAKQGLRVPYHWHLISYWLRAVSSLAEEGHRGHMKGTRRRAQQLALPWDSSSREQSCVFPLRFYALEQDLTQGTNWTPSVLHKYRSWYVVGVS